MIRLDDIVRNATSVRLSQIRRASRDVRNTQRRQLAKLVSAAAETIYGTEHEFGAIHSYNDFRRVPINDYNSLRPYIELARDGECNVLWRGYVRWFAKSSGTTETRSKYIPVTQDGLRENHMRGMRDVAVMATHIYPEADLLSGKTLTLGGSMGIERDGEFAETGDLSAILIENTPRIAYSVRRPLRRTALTADFDEKIERICRESSHENISVMAGVPSWNLVLLSRLLEYTGKQSVSEVWPKLRLFVHGGVNFAPYRDVYKRLIACDKMQYMDTYNASEGFFAMADRRDADDMLLMTDYGMFYEFIPVNSLSDKEQAIPLDEVQTGVNYAMIITNSNGLWRYMIGDTVEFTSLKPYRIKISGRTRCFINAFGEELIVDNAEQAIAQTCKDTDSEVAEYTAAPIYMNAFGKGAHQWIIEFRRRPQNIEEFAEVLDENLKRLNSDYEAKRTASTTLDAPVITPVPQGTFMEWLRQNGMLGGQHKVPRLSNDRKLAEQILALAKQTATA